MELQISKLEKSIKARRTLSCENFKIEQLRPSKKFRKEKRKLYRPYFQENRIKLILNITLYIGIEELSTRIRRRQT